jgi:dual specificity phosphatase 12
MSSYWVNDADQIIPRLWLGNFNSSQDIEFIKNNRITVIINCTKDLPFLSVNGVYKYRVPVDDNLQREEIIAMTQWIRKILPIIDEHNRGGRSILIHCAAGMQRSAIVVLSYLYKYTVFHNNSHDPKAILIKLRSKRPIVFTPYMNFGDSFRMYFGADAYRRLVE